MTSPKDILNSWRGLEQRLSSGELKRALPNNHTDEELAEFRKSNDIPDKPEGYDVNLGNGFVWGEADQPLLADFTKFAHDRNMPGPMVKSALEWFANSQQRIADDIAQRDENERVNGTEALRAEWGKEFKQNLAAARNMFEGDSAALWNIVMGARAEDGTRLGNLPEVLKFFAGKSRELNPFATLVPEAGSAPAKTAETRMAEINVMMKDRPNGPYWKGPQSAALQQEWRTLYDMLEASKNKGRAA